MGFKYAVEMKKFIISFILVYISNIGFTQTDVFEILDFYEQVPETILNTIQNSQYQAKNNNEGNKLLIIPKFYQSDENTTFIMIEELIDLRQEPILFNKNNALVANIIHLVKNSYIQPYFYDESQEGSPMTIEEFEELLQFQSLEGKEVTPEKLYLVKLTSILEIKKGEGIIYHPYRLTLILPDGMPESYLGQWLIASFKYKDIAKLFYFNWEGILPQSASQLRKMGDFIHIREFKGYLSKYSNDKDLDLIALLHQQKTYKPESLDLLEWQKQIAESEQKKLFEYLETLY